MNGIKFLNFLLDFRSIPPTGTAQLSQIFRFLFCPQQCDGSDVRSNNSRAYYTTSASKQEEVQTSGKASLKGVFTAARASSSRVAPIVQFVRKAATFEFMHRLMLSSTCNSYKCTNNGRTLVSAFSTACHSVRLEQSLRTIWRHTWITVRANDSSMPTSLDPTRTNFLIVALRICKPVDQ